MQRFEIDLGVLPANAASLEGLAAQLRATSAAARRAIDGAARADGNPEASAVLEMVGSELSSSTAALSELLRSDAEKLLESASRYRQAEGHITGTNDAITAALWKG
jgi:hypothetical protein